MVLSVFVNIDVLVVCVAVGVSASRCVWACVGVLSVSVLCCDRAAFRILDRSGDGVLSLADLKSCMKETHSSRDPRELG